MLHLNYLIMDYPELERKRKRNRPPLDNTPNTKNGVSKEMVDNLKSFNLLLKHSIENNKDLKQYLKDTKKATENKELQDRVNTRRKEKLDAKTYKLISTLARKSKKSRREIISDLSNKKGIYEKLDSKTQEQLSKVDLKDFSDTNKKDSKIKEFFTNMIEKTDQVISKHEDTLKASLLGPLTLITSPFEDFFGGSLYDSFKNMFAPKKGKKNPTVSDLVKKGLDGFLYLGNELQSIFGKGKKKKEGEGGLFDMLGQGLKSLGPMIPGLLAKGGAIAALAGGIIWAISDGLAGMKMAGQWGTSKISGFLGGFLGGTGKGFKNAFKNAGKWALVGAGAGFLFGGPVGALIGGLAGAAIGGLLGFFGGQKIAQSFDKIGKWIYDNIWESTIIKQFRAFFASAFDRVFTYFNNQMQNVKDLFTGQINIFEFIGNTVKTVFQLMGGLISDFFNKNPIGKFITQYIIQPLINFFNKIGDFFGYLSTFKDPREIASMLLGGGFTKGLEDFSSKRREERQQEKKEDLLNTYKNELDTLYKNKYGLTYTQARQNLSQARASRTDVQNLENTGIALLIEGKKINANEVTNVQDAIIKSDGSIIHTSPDDNIIATKNDPQEIQTSSNINLNTSSMEKRLDKMIGLLQALLDKDVTIQMPQQTAYELDSLIKGALL